MIRSNPGELSDHLEQLTDLIEASQVNDAKQLLLSWPDDERYLLLSRLEPDLQLALLDQTDVEFAATILSGLPESIAVELLDDLEPHTAADILDELPQNEQADLVGELDDPSAQAILAEMEGEGIADRIRRLSEYEDDEAGGLMSGEFVSVDTEATVDEVIRFMRANVEVHRDYDVQYVYACDNEGHLRGVLPLRDLLLCESDVPVSSIMIPNPVSVVDSTSLADLDDLFSEKPWLGVPVTFADGVLAGVVHRDAVESALADRNADDYLRTQGLIREELRTMPLWTRSRRRLAWLSVNILLNLIAASVIAAFQDTLQQVIALAVFLPIISDMSGCSGNQAVAVSMRELALNLVEPREYLRVLWKELSVGLINGLALGLLVALAAIVWQGNPVLGLVVGVALMANTVIAVTLGGCLPLVMKRMGLDPALASGPILTTVTDMCGFLIVLSLASSLLSWLV